MLDVINALKADSLIHGSWILDEVAKASQGLMYQNKEQSLPYEDYYRVLLDEVDNMSSIQLQPVVSPGTSRAYLIDLTTGLETVLDQIENITNKVLFFQSKVKAARVNLGNLSSTFKAWYLIALQNELKRFEFKLPNTAMNAISESEFHRLVGDAFTDMEALDGALTLLADRLKSRKKLASEKYSLGKDQANMSLLPQLGFQAGYSDDQSGMRLLKDKYGLGEERPSMVLDEPPPEMVRRKRPEQTEGTAVATRESMTKVIESEPAVELPEFDEVVDLDTDASGTLLASDPEPEIEDLMAEAKAAGLGVFATGQVQEFIRRKKVDPVNEASVTSNDDEVFTPPLVKKTSSSVVARRKMMEEVEEAQPVQFEPAPPAIPETVEPQAPKPPVPVIKKRRIVFDDED
jgi:hypothetical protein